MQPEVSAPSSPKPSALAAASQSLSGDARLEKVNQKPSAAKTEIDAAKGTEVAEHPALVSQPEEKPAQSNTKPSQADPLPARRTDADALQRAEKAIEEDDVREQPAEESKEDRPAEGSEEAGAPLPLDPSITPAKQKDGEQQPSILECSMQKEEDKDQKPVVQLIASKASQQGASVSPGAEPAAASAAKDQAILESKAEGRKGECESLRKLQVRGQDNVEEAKKHGKGESPFTCKLIIRKLHLRVHELELINGGLS